MSNKICPNILAGAGLTTEEVFVDDIGPTLDNCLSSSPFFPVGWNMIASLQNTPGPPPGPLAYGEPGYYAIIICLTVGVPLLIAMAAYLFTTHAYSDNVKNEDEIEMDEAEA